MPRKLTPEAAVPTRVQERLALWGRCIRAQRMTRRITSAELAARMGVSRATLQRLERGDPGAAAAHYLRALLVLGLLDEAVPLLPPVFLTPPPILRVVHPRKPSPDDDEFF